MCLSSPWSDQRRLSGSARCITRDAVIRSENMTECCGVEWLCLRLLAVIAAWWDSQGFNGKSFQGMVISQQRSSVLVNVKKRNKKTLQQWRTTDPKQYNWQLFKSAYRAHFELKLCDRCWVNWWFVGRGYGWNNVFIGQHYNKKSVSVFLSPQLEDIFIQWFARKGI